MRFLIREPQDTPGFCLHERRPLLVENLPEIGGCDGRPFTQGTQIRPGYPAVHQRRRRVCTEATVCTCDHSLPSDDVGVTLDALCHQLRVFDEVRRCVDDARQEHLVIGNFEIAPDRPFVFMAGICSLERDSAGARGQHDVQDTGNSGIWTSMMIEVRPGQTYRRAAGSLGWSFPASIGAKAACPNRPVICFTGDAGFYYHIARAGDCPALRHCARSSGQQQPLVEPGDRRLSPVRAPESQPELLQKMWKFEEADFARIAEAFGCAGFRVEHPGSSAPR